MCSQLITFVFVKSHLIIDTLTFDMVCYVWQSISPSILRWMMIKASTFVTTTLIHSATHMCVYVEYELYVIALNEVINTPFCNKCVFTLYFIHCLTRSICWLNYLAIWYTCTTLTLSRTMPHRLDRYSLRAYKNEIEKISKMFI